MIKRSVMFKHVPVGIVFRQYKDVNNLFYKIPEQRPSLKCDSCGEVMVYNARNIASDKLVHFCPTECVFPVYDGNVRDTAFPEFLQGDDAKQFLGHGFCDMCLSPAKDWAEPDIYGNVTVYGEYDTHGDLVGFLCPDCVRKREAVYGES